MTQRLCALTENFTSESFAYVLQYLIDHQPAIAVSVLHRLTGGRLDLDLRHAASVTVSTQVSVTQGRPDIEIRAPGHLVYVEVKVEADVDEDQLRRYREALERSGHDHTTLVLLTRYPMTVTRPGCPDVAVRWHDIADWLEEALSTERQAHASTAYLVGQFLDFLYARNLGMEKVGPELSRGVEALGHLLAMLKEAIDGDKRIKISNPYLSSTFVGYYLGTSAYYCELYYEHPAVLQFETYKVTLSKECFDTINVGQLWEERPVGLRWRNRLDLEGEDIGFFALSKAEQLRCIERFYHDSLDIAVQLTAPIPWLC